MLTRLRRVLSHPKLGFTEQAVDSISHEIVEWVAEQAWVPDLAVPPAGARRSRLCPDPEDEIVLRVALSAGAAFLVTGDTHLLKDLAPDGARLVRKAGLAIVTAREFVERLPASP